MDTQHRYELKCRRCGNIVAYYCGISEWADFRVYIAQNISDPCLQECKTCEKLTVQDIVSMYKTPSK